MTDEYRLSRFLGAAALLPPQLRKAAGELPERVKLEAEEFRLRNGQTAEIVLPGEGFRLSGHMVSGEDIALTLEIATKASAYAALEGLRSGFVAVKGGHRLGVCGTAAVKDGELINLRQISSLSLRIAKECTGIATPLMPRLCREGRLKSTLILSPPGGGKTSLLRDIIRIASDGEGRIKPHRVSVCDERGEIAACLSGVPTMDVGKRTDVLSGCGKAGGLMMLLRSMNPEVVAVDEITAPEDIAAAENASYCGAEVIATAHAGEKGELYKRPLYLQLMKTGVFKRLVIITWENGQRKYTVERTQNEE